MASKAATSVHRGSPFVSWLATCTTTMATTCLLLSLCHVLIVPRSPTQTPLNSAACLRRRSPPCATAVDSRWTDRRRRAFTRLLYYHHWHWPHTHANGSHRFTAHVSRRQMGPTPIDPVIVTAGLVVAVNPRPATPTSPSPTSSRKARLLDATAHGPRDDAGPPGIETAGPVALEIIYPPRQRARTPNLLPRKQAASRRGRR